MPQKERAVLPIQHGIFSYGKIDDHAPLDVQNFASTLKKLQSLRNISNYKLEKDAGLSKDSVKRFSKMKDVNLSTLVKCAMYFQVKPSDLLRPMEIVNSSNEETPLVQYAVKQKKFTSDSKQIYKRIVAFTTEHSLSLRALSRLGNVSPSIFANMKKHRSIRVANLIMIANAMKMDFDELVAE